MNIRSVCVMLMLSASLAHAEEILCRPEINPVSASELAYKQRGDRCEGLFAQKVSATGLRIVAFHKHPASYDETSLALNILLGETLTQKSLTVTSLKPKQFYRMDAVSSGDVYSLPLDIVRHPDVKVAPTDFAAVICAANCDTLLPKLTPASFSNNVSPNPYVALVADLEIFELHVMIKDGNSAEVLFEKEMLGNRTWPAARPATFPLRSYLDGRESVIFEITAVGRGNKLIDNVSAHLLSE